jgi:hypothetical protein
MRFLLIGNFIPPYEEENLHNLTLLHQLQQEGHDCNVINIDELSAGGKSSLSKDSGIVFARNYIDFIMKVIRYGFKSNVIHFLTKGYTRPGLMKLGTAVLLGKIMFKKIIVTLHPEMFSIFGQLRSKMGGQQLLHLSFSMANRIICGDAHTYNIASSHYSDKKKFTVIPPFFLVPEGSEISNKHFNNLEGRKNIIVLSGVKYPSLIFDVLNDLLNKHFDPETGIVISISEQKVKQLQHVLVEAHGKFMDNIVFVWPYDARMISLAYARADVVVRTLSCDCRPLFNDISLVVKKPVQSSNSMYFRESLIFIKEGDASDTIAYIINKLLKEKSERPPLDEEDYYGKIKGIYSGKD